MLTNVEQKIVGAVSAKEVQELCVEAVRTPSYTPPYGGELELAEVFGKRLKTIGADVEFQEVRPERPNVIGRIKGKGGGRSVLFNGHIDTTIPCLGWTRDPIGGEIEGGKLYGHGSSNMKGSCAAMIAALSAFKRAKVEFTGDVITSFVMGECRGGTGTKHMLSEGMKADCFVNGEPTDMQVLLLHSGVCQLKIIIKGRTSHFALPDKGVNAIEKMIKLLGGLGESMVTIDSNGWLKKRIDTPNYEGFPKFNLGAIRGGLTEDCSDQGVCNTPDYCIASLDVRFPPGLNSKLIQEDLEAVIQRFSNEDPDLTATVHLDPEFQMPPYEANLDDPIVRVIREASTDVRGIDPPVGALSPWKFMGADCGHMHDAGIPGVMLGVGTFTSSVPDEYIELSKAVDLAKIYALTFYRVAGEEKSKLN